jgi:hypothetical protein
MSDFSITPAQRGRYDLVVVGGGQAGCAAALAGARGGLKVLLIEAGGALGGSAVNCLVNPFMPDVTKVPDGNGGETNLHLSQGMYTEFAKALDEEGIYSRPNPSSTFHEESLKVILDRKMAEADVKVIFHATLCGVKTEGRMVKAVAVATVGGVLSFEADAVIDATGDATLAAYAGVPFQLGRASDSLCQPMTLCFRICNIDVDAAWRAHGDINALYKKLQAEGKIKNPRENVLVFPTKLPGVMHFNTTRVVRHDPTDAFSVSEAEAIAREQVVEMFHFLKENFAPFKDAALVSTASSIGVRESRMIEARHVLTQEEIVAGTHFEDGIAAGNYDIDIHSPDGSGTSHYYFPAGVYYTIPYRCLLPKDYDNLLVAGRSIGATHEAQASIRIMPICICLGEAAGTAAALAKETGVAPADINTDALRQRLRANGAFVG